MFPRHHGAMYTLERKLKEIYACVWSHMNAHQRGTSAEENFNNQVDRATCSVYASQHLSPGTLVIIQWAYEQSGHDGRDGSYAWAQQHGLPLTTANLAWSLLNAQSASRRHQL